jgi:hypothetical protein
MFSERIKFTSAGAGEAERRPLRLHSGVLLDAREGCVDELEHLAEGKESAGWLR